MENKKFIVSRDVVFDEIKFPYVSKLHDVQELPLEFAKSYNFGENILGTQRPFNGPRDRGSLTSSGPQITSSP